MCQNKLEEAPRECENVLVNKHVFYCYHSSLAYKQVLKFCVYVYVCVWSHVQTPSNVDHKLLKMLRPS